MSQDDRMPKIEESQLKPYELNLIRLVEKQNFERVQKLKLLRRRNIITGCLLGLSVCSIYGYSMWAVKQESFLDDFDEPEKTVN